MMKISICSDRPSITPCELDRYNYQLDPYIGCEHYCNFCYVLRRLKQQFFHKTIHTGLN